MGALQIIRQLNKIRSIDSDRVRRWRCRTAYRGPNHSDGSDAGDHQDAEAVAAGWDGWCDGDTAFSWANDDPAVNRNMLQMAPDAVFMQVSWLDGGETSPLPLPFSGYPVTVVVILNMYEAV